MAPAEHKPDRRRAPAAKGRASAPGPALGVRAAWLDCFSGVAGNMLLGAIIDAGVDEKKIESAARRVVAEFQLRVTDAQSAGLGGKLVDVDLGHHRHHGAVEENHHPHKHSRGRNLPEIERLITASGLAAPVIEKSIRVFRRLAEAEARVHRKRPDEVHFHEVGAVDAIVDVVGTVFGLHELGVERLYCSPLPLMGGEVECAHGTLPLPAPATAELLRGVPVRGLPGEGELVTPTGAALVTTLADAFGPIPAMTVEAVGVGLGHRDLPFRPNLLRLIVGRVEGAAETAVQFEAAVDDMSPEHFDFLLDRLHQAGAVEVLFIPAQMKKNRPGVLVRALCPPPARDAVRAALLDHSTTLGAREWEVGRVTLPRESATVATAYGEIRVKSAKKPGGSVRLHVEYDDLKRAAERTGATLAEVEAAALDAARREKP